MGTEASGPTNNDLKFLPRVLTENCQRLVESYHAIHGYASLPDILWRAEVRDFVEMNSDLRVLYRKASITRSARKANASYVLIASALLSLEILATDFLGWGTRFPFAKRKAASLLAAHVPATRAQLRDVYLRQQNYVRPQVINTAIAPPPDLATSHAGAAANFDEDVVAPSSGQSREAASRRHDAM
jgi:hypothetical protein